MQRFKQILPIIAFCSISLLLSACQTDRQEAQATHVNKQRDEQIDALSRRGVDVIDLGQTIRLTFLSNRFFEGQSATIIPSQTATLEQVATFANSFPNANIAITGYSNDVLPNLEAKANSLAQARAIAGFLWNDGLTSTRMQVQGKGYVAPLNDNNSPAAGAENRRVEMLISPAN